VPVVSDLEKILKQSKSLKKLGSEKLFLLPPTKGSTSGKEEFVEPEYFYTPYPESRYKFEEIFEFPEETEYPPLENILILEEVQEEKPNLSLQVNILASEKLAEEILQSSPKIQLVNIPKLSSPQSPQSSHTNQPLGGQTMVGAAPPNPMDAIRVARYAPLVLPNNLHPLPTTDYMKYLPRFDNEGETTAEEHLTSFYSFADNFQVDYDDVWMKLFVQSLDGEVRKWFRNLRAKSITTITDLDATFLRKWGEKKDDMY
jgi:hypothetical protein